MNSKAELRMRTFIQKTLKSILKWLEKHPGLIRVIPARLMSPNQASGQINPQNIFHHE
jgi:hypothetical protein